MQLREVTILVKFTDLAQRYGYSSFDLRQAGGYVAPTKLDDAESVSRSLVQYLQVLSQGEIDSFALRVSLYNTLSSNVPRTDQLSQLRLELILACQNPENLKQFSTSRLRFPGLKKECLTADGQVNPNHIAIKKLEKRILQTSPLRYGNNLGYFFCRLKSLHHAGTKRGLR